MTSCISLKLYLTFKYDKRNTHVLLDKIAVKDRYPYNADAQWDQSNEINTLNLLMSV